MPAISHRGEIMPPSPIRKLVPFAEAAKKRGTTVYHLNIGQPDIETPEVMLNAFKNLDMDVIEYGHSQGLESYRSKLAGYYQANNIHVTAEDMVITTGGSEAIIFAMITTMNPGDEIIIPEPFYTNYNGFATQAGVVIKPITSHIEDNFALPKISDFETLITDKTKAIMICNPGNPTGYVYSREELEELKSLVVKHDLFLLADEVYREFTYEGTEYVSILHLDGIDDRAIILDSVSKRYSACGARVGALVCKNKQVIDVALRLGQARLCPPTVEQLAAEAAIDTPQSYFDDVNAEYFKRRNIVIEQLSQMEGVTFGQPNGAFYLVAKLPIKNADHFCQWLLEEFNFHDQTVMLAPAAGFYATKGLGESEVRIAYVLEETSLKSAMACLSEALKVYNG